MRYEIETYAMHTLGFIIFISIDHSYRQDVIELSLFYSRLVIGTILFALYVYFHLSPNDLNAKMAAISYYSTVAIIECTLLLRNVIGLHGEDICTDLNSLYSGLLNCYTENGYMRRVYISIVAFVILIFFTENTYNLVTKFQPKDVNPTASQSRLPTHARGARREDNLMKL